MRIMFSSFLALLGLAVSSAPALAESFSGPHIEATLGWNHDGRNRDTFGTHGGSLLYGGGAGYDLRFGRVVAGIQGELADTTAKNCFDENATYPNGSTVVGHGCYRSGISLFGGARLGYVMSEHTLLYVLGGYAHDREQLKFAGTLDGSPYQSRDTVDRSGYRVGAGIEQSIAGHAFVKAEYRYTHTGRYDADQNQVVTAVGWRF